MGLWRQIEERGCGLVVSPDKDRLAGALLRMAANLNREEMGRRGHKLVHAHYTWNTIAQDLVAQIRFNGGSAAYLQTFDEIVRHLQSALAEGDLVVTMGAGNIWEVADDIVRWLGTDR